MKATNLGRKIFSIAVKTSLFSFLILTILPFSARAQCQRWEVSGKWRVKLRTGAVVGVVIKPLGKGLSATAYYEASSGSGSDNNVYLMGDKFGLVLDWDTKDTTTGTNIEYYSGTIASDGTISGIAKVFGHLREDTSWVSDRPMVCAETGRFTPIHRLKITPPTSKEPDPPPPTTPADTVPMIRALPNNVIVRTPQTQGRTTLTWDGGKDHPYAEIWVKIDDADETFVVEQGKGSRQVTVDAGKTYLYILTDAGKTLATVKVKFRQGGQVHPMN